MNLAIVVILVGIVASAHGTIDLSNHIDKGILAKGQTLAVLIRKKIATEGTVKLVFIAGQTKLSQECGVAVIDLVNIYEISEVEFLYTNPIDRKDGTSYAADCIKAMGVLVGVMTALGVKVQLIDGEVVPTDILKSSNDGATVYAFDFIFGKNYKYKDEEYNPVKWNCKLLEDAIIAECKIVVVDVFALHDKDGNVKTTGLTSTLKDSKVLVDVYISMEMVIAQTQNAAVKITTEFYLLAWNSTTFASTMEGAIGIPLNNAANSEKGGYNLLSFANTTELKVTQWYRSNIISIIDYLKEYVDIPAATPMQSVV